MKLNFAGKISKSSMILLIVAALFAVAGAFTSVWRIDLTAPQYPEGMVLYIGGTEGVSGGDEGNDLYKINELNHYVGMAQIHPGDFWEFTVLPILLCAFEYLVFLALLTSITGHMSMVITSLQTLQSRFQVCHINHLSLVKSSY